MEFHCIEGCAQCCIDREYFPSKKFGKIGVLILPEEKEKIEKFAKIEGIDILILPRIGISKERNQNSIQVLAYQMMGKEHNGNTCPFLDTNSNIKSPHGGQPCKIYQNRPLACQAYPLIDSKPIMLDSKCMFCQEKKTANDNLNSEIESLAKIQIKMKTKLPFIWRYATGIGEEIDKTQIKKGWILEE